MMTTGVRRLLDLFTGASPVVCGIVNVTPDSFSDDGLFHDVKAALRHALRLVEEGADMLDVGGESTRPGAQPPSLREELRRVVPVIAAISEQVSVPISVDTSRPEVMRAAVEAGASMINDVRALRDADARSTAASLNVPVCLMHMAGEPATMQEHPHFEDVVREVCTALARYRSDCLAAGIPKSHVILDPGFGFGKRHGDNLDLLAHLPDVVSLGAPVMVGLSRKSMIGTITGRSVGDRTAGSIATAIIAAQAGVRILRVHDVRETRDALAVLAAVGGRR